MMREWRRLEGREGWMIETTITPPPPPPPFVVKSFIPYLHLLLLKEHTTLKGRERETVSSDSWRDRNWNGQTIHIMNGERKGRRRRTFLECFFPSLSLTQITHLVASPPQNVYLLTTPSSFQVCSVQYPIYYSSFQKLLLLLFDVLRWQSVSICVCS